MANVAARAAQLDHQIEFAIETLLDERRNTAEFLLKRGMSGDRLTDLLEALLRDTFPQEHPAIAEHITEIRNARSARNDLLHWLWQRTDDPAVITTARVRPYREKSVRQKTIQQVMAIAEAMLNSVLRLSEWQDRYQAEKLRALHESNERLSALEHLLSTSNHDQTGTPAPPARPAEASQEYLSVPSGTGGGSAHEQQEPKR